MSELKVENITIFEALSNIKNGKYVMPAFQRQFSWSMEQIEKLWDSILLDYPISNFLFWHVDDDNTTCDTYFCNFLQSVTFDSRKHADSKNYEISTINTQISNIAVLDGQQRLTALYLSLFGDTYIRSKYARKNTIDRIPSKLVIELNKNNLTIDEEEYNIKKFDIKFTDKIGKLSPTQFDIRDLLKDKFRNESTRNQSIDEVIKNVPLDSREYAKNILTKLYKKIFEDKIIHCTFVFDMKQDDALEIFVRSNSGGKVLKKSEITMSILEAYWPNAKSQIGQLLIGSYKDFDTDFIIRSSLMLYGDVIKSNINKNIAENLHNNWNNFKKALINLDILFREMNINIERYSNSWNVLLPIIYYIYWNPDFKNNKDAIKVYLVRAILLNYFINGTTGKLQQMKSFINENNREITVELLDQINDLRVTEAKIEDILNQEIGSRVAGKALYFLSLNWIKNSIKYDQDHLHPYERFDSNPPFSVTIEAWSRWRNNRNKLPNLQLLEGRSNKSKNAISLQEYFNDMNEEQRKIFINQAYIPENVSFELEQFEDFYEKRKELLKLKLKELLCWNGV